MLFDLLLGKTLVFIIVSHAAFLSDVKIGVNEYPVRMIIPQQVICAATDDHAVGKLRKLLQRFLLRLKDRLQQLRLIITHKEAVVDRDGEQPVIASLHHLMDVFFGETGVPGDLFNDLPVVILYAEFFRTRKSFLKEKETKSRC